MPHEITLRDFLNQFSHTFPEVQRTFPGSPYVSCLIFIILHQWSALLPGDSCSFKRLFFVLITMCRFCNDGSCTINTVSTEWDSNSTADAAKFAVYLSSDIRRQDLKRCCRKEIFLSQIKAYPHRVALFDDCKGPYRVLLL